jgi:hypothetical protein
VSVKEALILSYSSPATGRNAFRNGLFELLKGQDTDISNQGPGRLRQIAAVTVSRKIQEFDASRRDGLALARSNFSRNGRRLCR